MRNDALLVPTRTAYRVAKHVLIAVLAVATNADTLAAPIRILEESVRLTGPEPLDFQPLDVEVYINDMVVVAAARDGSWNLHRFECVDGTWQYAEQLFSTMPIDDFDRPSLALRDSVIGFAQRNAVHVFQQPFGTYWAYSTTLTPPTGFAEIGSDVEYGSGLFVGAETGRYQAIRYFGRPRVVWVYGEHFNGPLIPNDQPDFYGGDIATDYEAMALGAPLLTPDGRPDGRVHVFSGRHADLTQEKVLRAPTGHDARDFGRYIGMTDRTLVATSGDGILHLYDGANFSWAYQGSTRTVDRLSRGLGSPGVSGDLVAYAMDDDDRGIDAGAIAIYRREGSRLRQVAELYASERIAHGLAKVSIQGTTVAATGQNSVLVFQLPTDFSTPEIVQDDFEQSDAARWMHSLTGQSSVVTSDASRVYRQQSLLGAAHSIARDTNWTDQSIQADVMPGNVGPDSWSGLAVRYQDADNHYYLALRESGELRLRKKVNGVYTTLDTMFFGFLETGRIRLEAIGTRIRASINNRVLLEAVDSSLRRGRAALLTYRARTDFDNVVITPSPLTAIFVDWFDSDALDGWTTTGQWTPSGAQRSVGGVARASGGVVTDDQMMSAFVMPEQLRGQQWVGIFVRHTNDADYYYLKLSETELSLRKVVNSSITELARMPFPGGEPNRFYDLRLEAVGTSIRAYVNGTFLLGATDTSHRSGRQGLITYKARAQFGDVEVWQP